MIQLNHKAILEIGTEEIPAKKVAGIHHNLKTLAEELMDENRISVKEINVIGAPRRLTLIFDQISEYQDDLVEEIKGPPYNIAFDDEGNPTKAAVGFAGNNNIEVDDLEIRDTDNGKYMFAIIERKNQATVELLPEIFSQIITDLDFPVTMRWGDKDLEFIRPIHWICSMFDEKVIEFEVEGIKSGAVTRGHRFLSDGEIKINSAADYIDQLRQEYVIVDPQERKEKILSGIKSIEQNNQGHVETDPELMEEVIHLVEYPTPFCGEFEKRYLKLPEPVLVTPTKEHQRYFPVRNHKDELISKFVGVRDGGENHLETVTEGNEKVLRARFADAEFYYEKDLEISMETRINKLQGIVFREELGTMYDKVNRIKKIVSWLGNKIDLPCEKIADTERAAYLSKADLVSHMVREFPELQGIMGKVYAKREGENQQVCRAISEHYRPKFSEDDLPSSTEARLISIADKFDTLVGCFGIGLIPTGSEDPYGLRRSAIGIIRIIEDSNIDIKLTQMCGFVIDLFSNLTRPEENVKNEVVNFLLERLDSSLNNRGISYDVIQSSIKGLPANVPQIVSCSELITDIKNEKMFIELVTAYNRVQSIIKSSDNKQNQINSELLLESEEKNLYNTYLEVSKKLDNINKRSDFRKIYQILKSLIDPVHNFFENVIVMADREEIKQNRLNLLNSILEQMSLLGELSEIVVE